MDLLTKNFACLNLEKRFCVCLDLENIYYCVVKGNWNGFTNSKNNAKFAKIIGVKENNYSYKKHAPKIIGSIHPYCETAPPFPGTRNGKRYTNPLVVEFRFGKYIFFPFFLPAERILSFLMEKKKALKNLK